MSLSKLTEHGFSDKLIRDAAAAYIATMEDGTLDKGIFMQLSGYTTASSAGKRLNESKSAIRAIRASLLNGGGVGTSAAASPKTPAKRKAGGTVGSAVKKSKVNQDSKQTKEQIATGELDDDEEEVSPPIKQEESTMGNGKPATVKKEKSVPEVKAEPSMWESIDDLV